MTNHIGFFGKIPTRGDFVRSGLPMDFIQALDKWWQEVIPESRLVLQGGWEAAWMEAPIWRFAFGAGCCGPAPAAGLWLPSTDSAGRLFPLTIAMVGAQWADLASASAFLDQAEAAGLQALEQDVTPEDLAAAISAPLPPYGGSPAEPARGASAWTTTGSPLVTPAQRQFAGLPSGRQFAAMLSDAARH